MTQISCQRLGREMEQHRYCGGKQPMELLKIDLRNLFLNFITAIPDLMF